MLIAEITNHASSPDASIRTEVINEPLHGVAMADFNGELVAVYAPSRNNELHWIKTRDGKNWTSPTRIPWQQTRSKPSVCTFDGALCLCYRDESNNLRITYTRDLNDWAIADDNQFYIGGTGVQTRQGLSVRGYQNTLVAAHRGNDRKIWFNWSGSKSMVFGESRPWPDTGTDYAPALHNLDNRALFCFHVTDEGHIAYSNDGGNGTWTDWVRLSDLAASDLSIASNRGDIYCAYKSETNSATSLVRLQNGTQKAGSAVQFFEMDTTAAPEICEWNGKLWMAC